MFPPPPPTAGDPLVADDLEDEDDDVDMQLDDDDPRTAPFDTLNSSPSSSTDDDDRSPNPNPNTSTILQNGAVAVQPSPISTFETPDAKRQAEDSRRLFQRLWTDDDEIAILQGFHDFTMQRGTAHLAHQHDTGPFYEQIKNRLQLDFTKNQLVEKIRRLKKKYRNVLARMASGGREFAYKSPHERAMFEISRKIWSGATSWGGNGCDEDGDGNERGDEFVLKERIRKRKRRSSSALGAVSGFRAGAEVRSTPDPLLEMVDVKSVPILTATAVELKPVPGIMTTPVEVTSVPVIVNGSSSAGAVTSSTVVNSNVVEETVKSCIAPLFKELLSCATNGPVSLPNMGGSAMAMVLGLMPPGFMANLSPTGGTCEVSEGKWRNQQILELEVYSKRLELVQEEIKAALEELRSSQ